LTQTDGSPDYLSNFDVVYDASRERFFAVREQHPFPLTEPVVISPSLQLVSIAAKDLLRGRGKWAVEATITPSLTGQLRNHNACIERTATGALPDPREVKIIFSSSCAGTDCAGKNPLWTYALWQITGKITDTK
jgi:hypothetical protein